MYNVGLSDGATNLNEGAQVIFPKQNYNNLIILLNSNLILH